jgi:hypothetical protein
MSRLPDQPQLMRYFDINCFDFEIALMEPAGLSDDDDFMSPTPARPSPAGSIPIHSLFDLSHLSEAERLRMVALLDDHADCFARTSADLGCCTMPGCFHQIDTGDAVPMRLKPYKYSNYEIAFLKTHLDELLATNIIRPSKSPWLSPAVIVEKPGGGLRLCINYRRLNSFTQRDPYPLPLVDKVLSSMAGMKYFSSLDLISGFWQIPMHPESMGKTAFSTPFGNFEFSRTPFGLVNAPATFSRVIALVMAELPFVHVFMDDIFVASRTFEEHIEHLRIVFERLRSAGLKIKPAKCKFACSRIQCLGFMVDGAGIHTCDDKIEAINFPPPTDVAGIRSFLSMSNFYQQFIPNYSAIAEPLRLLTRKNSGFRGAFTPAQQVAFNTLKERLRRAPVLRQPDFSLPFILTTDWSVKGLGAVLSQRDPSTQAEQPVAFASRACTPPEGRYSPTEGECLALVWAIAKFRPYIHGRIFDAYTDHGALQWLGTKKSANTKLERWALQLQEYTFTVHYKRGVENVVADCLSRYGVSPTVPPFGFTDPIGSHEIFAEGATPTNTTIAGAASVVSTHACTSSLDDAPCTVCGDTGGWDNMCICDECGRFFHLRCLIPPQTTPPSGPWICGGCDPLFSNLHELRHPQTPLCYRPGDPFLNEPLLTFLEGGKHNVDVLPAPQRKHLLHLASSLQLHPKIPGFLLVYKRIRNADSASWLICPPVEYRYDIIRLFHEALGHAGITSLLRVLHMHYHWRGIRADVELFIRCCDACQRQKLILPEPPELQQPCWHGPLQHVHIDLAGPFPAGVPPPRVTEPRPLQIPGKVWVVLMVDAFTKAAEFFPIVEKSALTVSRVFYDGWVCRYGVPSFVTSDNGSEFCAEFEHTLRRLGVEHIHTSVCHPSANGAVERLVQSFKRILYKLINNHPVNWQPLLPHVRMSYMNRLHATLGVSPNEMLFGYRPVLPLPAPVLAAAAPQAGTISTHVARVQERLFDLDQVAWSAIRAQFARNRALMQKARTAHPPRAVLQPGDLVLELDDSVPALYGQVKGPFVVLRLKNRGTVAELSTGATHARGAVSFDRHVTRLSRYFTTGSI